MITSGARATPPCTGIVYYDQAAQAFLLGALRLIASMVRTGGGTSVSFAAENHIEFRSAETAPIDKFFEASSVFRDFLSLAMMRPVWPTSFEGWGEAPSGDRDVHQFMEKGMVIHRPYAFWPEVEEKWEPHHTLFRYRAIEEDFGRFVRAYFDTAQRDEQARALYASVVRNPHVYLEGVFLSLAQAIECYHRGRFGEAELHLRMRLERLMGIWEEGSGKRIPLRDEFAPKIVVTRNYLTHYDPSKKDRAYQVAELHRASEKLKIILEMAFLRDMGMEPHQAHEFISRNAKYHYIFHPPTV